GRIRTEVGGGGAGSGEELGQQVRDRGHAGQDRPRAGPSLGRELVPLPRQGEPALRHGREGVPGGGLAGRQGEGAPRAREVGPPALPRLLQAGDGDSQTAREPGAVLRDRGRGRPPRRRAVGRQGGRGDPQVLERVTRPRPGMEPPVVPTRWKSGMIEVGPRVFAYVQASGIDPAGDTGVSNSGLILGREGNVLVDALMVPSMTRRLVAAIKKTTRKPIATLINTHHHLDHTGGNRFFAGATRIASEKCREALAPGFPPLPLLRRFMPRFAREFPLLQVVLPTVTFKDHLVIHDGDREIQLWHPGFAAHTVGDAVAYLPRERVLFAGDIAFHYVTPLAFQGHVGNWSKAAGRPTTRVYEGGSGEDRSGNHPSTNRGKEPRRVVSYRHTDPNALTPDSLLATLSQLESRPPEVGSRPSTSRRRIGQAAARIRP